jgi:hypothetical protein
MGRTGVDVSRYHGLFIGHLRIRQLTPQQFAAAIDADSGPFYRFVNDPKRRLSPLNAVHLARELGRDVRELGNYDWSKFLALFDSPSPPFLQSNVVLVPARRDQLEMFAARAQAKQTRRSVRQDTTPALIRVAISYAREDGLDFSEACVARLEAAGCAVWRDVPSLNNGEPWREGIRTGIVTRDVLIVIITNAACRSRFVAHESGIAIGAGVAILPILRHLKAKIPDEIAHLSCMEFGQIFDWPRLVAEVHRLAARRNVIA